MQRSKRLMLAAVALAGMLLTGVGLSVWGAGWAQAEDSGGATAGTTGNRATISIQGRGEVQAAPDQLLLDIGVVTTAATAREAQEENARRAEQVIRGFVAQGIDRKDIQSISYSLQPQYDYGNQKEGQPPKIVGYQVFNLVRVRVRNLSQAGSIIDRAVGEGANQVQGLQFVLSDDAAARSQALEKAVADARLKAEAIARALGRPLGEVLSVQESGVSYPEPLYFRSRSEMADAVQAVTPVEPGQLTVSASVQVVYTLK